MTNEDYPGIERRTFLRGSLALPPLIAALFAAAVTVSCGDSDTDVNDESSSDGSVSGVIASPDTANHGHTVSITAAQLAAGTAVELTLTSGSDGHTHTTKSPSLTDQDVIDIDAGTQVVVTSTTDSAHFHTVTFN